VAAVLAADIGIVASGVAAGPTLELKSAAPQQHHGAAAQRRDSRGVPPALKAMRRRAAAVQQLLDTRAKAIRDRDRAAFAATLDPKSPKFKAAQLRVFANLAQVPIASWSYELDPGEQAPDWPKLDRKYGTRAYSPHVVLLHFTLAGFDTKPTSLPEHLTFVHRAGGWKLASDDDYAKAGNPSTHALWDYGPVEVTRTRDALVLGHPGSADLRERLAEQAKTDIPLVDDVWDRHWARRVVIEAPGSQAEMGKLLGGDEDLDQIAAVATAELRHGSGSPLAVGNRILVNPANYAKLGPTGRQVVLTHEITHVATRDATGPDTPVWLIEGFADYVGYLPSGVPTHVVATELRRAVQAGHAPTSLPGDAAFDGDNATLAQAYEKAWLACRLIAARHGRHGLVRFYRDVGDVRGSDEKGAVQIALKRDFGTTYDVFRSRWRSYVRKQLG
jgi:hypothetical protein